MAYGASIGKLGLDLGVGRKSIFNVGVGDPQGAVFDPFRSTLQDHQAGYFSDFELVYQFLPSVHVDHDQVGFRLLAPF